MSFKNRLRAFWLCCKLFNGFFIFALMPVPWEWELFQKNEAIVTRWKTVYGFFYEAYESGVFE